MRPISRLLIGQDKKKKNRSQNLKVSQLLQIKISEGRNEVMKEKGHLNPTESKERKGNLNPTLTRVIITSTQPNYRIFDIQLWPCSITEIRQ